MGEGGRMLTAPWAGPFSMGDSVHPPVLVGGLRATLEGKGPCLLSLVQPICLVPCAET